MTTSPDYTQYIDLTLFDKSPADIMAVGVSTFQSRVPDWIPSETNLEMVLMEAFAIEISEIIFTINRLPESMMETLLSLYQVTRYSGSPPSVYVTFTAMDDTGYSIPGNTEVVMLLPNGEYMSFYTNTPLTIVTPATTGTVQATATEYTNTANSVDIGTSLQIIDSLIGIDSVVTASVVAGGVLPETVESWIRRGIQRFQRLVDTLVLPSHFVQAALENPAVVRANAIDNYDPNADPPGVPGDHEGFITVVVYGDNAPLTNDQKIALNTTLTESGVTNIIVTLIDPTLTEVDVTVSVKVVSGYNSAAVLAAVTERLETYLSPNTWPWAGTVRRNEIISIVDQVPGVDYVGTLTDPAADIALSEGDTLTVSGTITVTAV